MWGRASKPPEPHSRFRLKKFKSIDAFLTPSWSAWLRYHLLKSREEGKFTTVWTQKYMSSSMIRIHLKLKLGVWTSEDHDLGTALAQTYAVCN